MSAPFPEEEFARELHAKLLAAGLASRLSGVGVHWHCSVGDEDHHSKTDCFGAQGAEYLSEFVDRVGTAWARTKELRLAVSTIVRWSQGASVADLIAEFEHVEERRRKLERLVEAASRVDPDLAAIATSMTHRGCDLYELSWSASDRSIDIRSNADTFVAFFRWQDGVVARWTVRTEDLPRLLRSWLITRIGAVELESCLPDGEMRPVARHYDQGEFLLGDFLASWGEIEEFYADMHFAEARLAEQLVARLRAHHFDRTLRAGQSLLTLLLSRARRHGLRRGQPFVSIGFSGSKVRATLEPEGALVSESQGPEPTPELIRALRDLESRAVD